MTKIIAANIGSYPRIGEQKDQQRYRRGLAHFQNKEISAHAFKDVEQSVVQEVIREQIDAGLDEITDGLVSWNDPISALCSKIPGFEITGLARYFDLNFFYRVPCITSKPRRRGALTVDDFKFAQSVSNKPVRAVLTGPLTLATHVTSRLKSFEKLAARVDFFTEILALEIRDLQKAGALTIQIDEPVIGSNPNYMSLLNKSLQTLSAGATSAQLVLAVYFFPLAPIYDELSNLPVAALNLDFTSDGKKLLEKILKTQLRKTLGFGLVSGRHTRLEPIDPLIYMIRDVIRQHDPAICYVTPSCGLEFVPRETAFAKIKLLAKLAQEAPATAAAPDNA